MTMVRTSHSALTSPTAKTDRPAGCSVSHSASAAAIFIGCCSNMSLAWKSPLTATAMPMANVSQIDVRTALRSADPVAGGHAGGRA